MGCGTPCDDGNRVNSGSSYVFDRNDERDLYVEQQNLLSSDGVEGDLFAYDVAFDGNEVVVGARFEDNELGVLSGRLRSPLGSS